MITIDPDKVCHVIVKARAFDAKEEVVEEDYASNPADEEMREVLQDYPDDPTYDELREFINALNEDEQIELVALTWVGRGSFTAEEWEEAKAEAARAHNERTAEYLLGMPLLADYLAEGLAAFGLSCEE
ncbi:MAG TPA: DUF3775 domain-containing protein [Rhodospirillales bacterium]|nr:DUF3775 domain-containing protein [Rhodospirillales bacterium]